MRIVAAETSLVILALGSPEYFGRTNFGAIFGLVMATNMLGSVLGPPLAGWVYDHWGSYQSIWFVFAGLPIAALMSVLTIPRGRPKSSC